jgi:succinylglutamate desuccinylase
MFLNNTYKNIPWITLIDSSKAWPNVGIFAITHWNEPVGLNIFDYLVSDFCINTKLKKWKLFLISVNIEAYKKYVNSWDFNEYRFVDDDMNRISNKSHKKNSLEFKRFQELKTIFDEIDIAIDIHSVPKWNDLIWLIDKIYLENAKKFFDTEIILVDDMWNTWALIWYFLRNKKEAYWIECWNHIDESWFNNWLKNILNFLSFFWFIDFRIVKNHSFPNIFEFFKEIIPQTDNFEFAEDYKWFTKIPKNKVYAMDGKLKLKNIYWNDIYVWIPMVNPKKWIWAWFLFRKC